MPSYRHLFFDLDHTLWDFERCSGETLEELFQEHQLHTLGMECVADFVVTFRNVNRQLWHQYGAGQITQQQLRESRFILVLNQLGVVQTDITAKLTEQYLLRCSSKSYLLPYAREVLDYLKEKYILHIITNGFDEVQSIKMASSGITGYFRHIVTSQKAGCHKPNRLIFDYARQLARALPEHCLMIGDSLEADIAGARNAGIDHVFYNYERLSHNETPTYEIQCLSELMKML